MKLQERQMKIKEDRDSILRIEKIIQLARCILRYMGTKTVVCITCHFYLNQLNGEIDAVGDDPGFSNLNDSIQAIAFM